MADLLAATLTERAIEIVQKETKKINKLSETTKNKIHQKTLFKDGRYTEFREEAN